MAQRDNRFLRLNTQHSKSGCLNGVWNQKSEKSLENYNNIAVCPADTNPNLVCPEQEYNNVPKYYTSLNSVLNDRKNSGNISRNNESNNQLLTNEAWINSNHEKMVHSKNIKRRRTAQPN